MFGMMDEGLGMALAGMALAGMALAGMTNFGFLDEFRVICLKRDQACRSDVSFDSSEHMQENPFSTSMAIQQTPTF